jgi:hypothetical protein
VSVPEYDAGADHVSAIQAGVPQVLSTRFAVMTGGDASVVSVDVAEYAEVPPEFTAATRKSYAVEPARPVTVTLVDVDAACANVVQDPDGEVRY